MLFVQLCLDIMFCQRIGGCDADDSFISILLRFPSDIRIELELITWLLVSRLYFSLQEFSGPTVKTLHDEQRQMVISIVRVGWILLVHLGLLIVIILLWHFLSHQLFNISLGRYLSTQPLLSTVLSKFCFADAQRTLQAWWLYFSGEWSLVSCILRCGKVLSDCNTCYRNTKSCQRSSESFVSKVTFVSFWL